MKARLWHWSLGCVTGAVVAAGLFSLVRAARRESDFDGPGGAADLILLVTFVGALAGGLAAVIISYLRRHPVIQVVRVPGPATTASPAPVPPPVAAPAAPAISSSPSKRKGRQAP